MPEFNSWSFFLGLTAGLVIRSTDIVPLTGGIVIGLMLRKVPDLLQLEHFPVWMQGYMIKWKKELENFNNEQIEIIENIMRNYDPNLGFSDYGKNKALNLIKKFGISEVI